MEQAHVRHMRTRYGMNGTVVIGPGFRHGAGLGGLLLPHPPVVNQLLRHRLPSRSCPTMQVVRESSPLSERTGRGGRVIHQRSASPAGSSVSGSDIVRIRIHDRSLTNHVRKDYRFFPFPRLGEEMSDRRSCGKKNDQNDRDSCPIPGMTQPFGENIEKLVAVPVPLADPDSYPHLFPHELRHDIPPFESFRPWPSFPGHLDLHSSSFSLAGWSRYASVARRKDPPGRGNTQTVPRSTSPSGTDSSLASSAMPFRWRTLSTTRRS